MLLLQDPTAASPALFSSIGASLGISPFQAALLNFTPGNHHTPRSHDGLPHPSQWRVCSCACLRSCHAVKGCQRAIQLLADSCLVNACSHDCIACMHSTCNPHPSHQACTCCLERLCCSPCHASCSHTRWLGPAGWNARTPLAFIGPPAALNVPAQWALQDVSSASVRPPRTDQVVDPAVCSMGPPIAPFSPDAGVSSDLHIGWVALCWLSFSSLKFIPPVGAHLAPGSDVSLACRRSGEGFHHVSAAPHAWPEP